MRWTTTASRRFLALNPNYPQAHLALGYGLLLAGDHAQSIAAFDRATALRDDPLWAYRTFHKAMAQFCAGGMAESLDTLRDLIDLKPSVRGFRKLQVLALRAAGHAEEAARAEAAAEALPDEPNYHVILPPLPDSHLWLRDALAPPRGPGVSAGRRPAAAGRAGR